MMAAKTGQAVPLQRVLGVAGVTEGPGVEVTAITLDSRAVTPGAAFVAVAGTTAHGLDFLFEALERGATVVLYDPSDQRWSSACAQQCREAGAHAVAVPDLASRLGAMAAALQGEPSTALEHVVAVTGTDGKTTVAQFVTDMLDDATAPAAALGTLGLPDTVADWPRGLTTPDAPGLQAVLARLVAGGIRRLALEASSHGLAQRRLDGTRIDVAVLTQLGRDHLDYHGSEAAYAEAKARLFAWPTLRAAAINADDPFGETLRGRLAPQVECVSYGRRGGALRIAHVDYPSDGLELTLHYDGHRGTTRLPVLGPFNADNAAAAGAALLGLGFGFEETLRRLRRVRPVPGRMELFHSPGRPGVVVDYAHNAGALEAALSAVRAHTRGRLWCIFGAGGDRDPGKRAPMGATAAAGADRVIVTDDNPRSEDPAAIVADILAGIDSSEVEVEHDRGRALEMVLERAGADDLILLAGKGHETDQERAGVRHPWSDRAAVQAALDLDVEAPS